MSISKVLALLPEDSKEVETFVNKMTDEQISKYEDIFFQLYLVCGINRCDKKSSELLEKANELLKQFENERI